MWVREEEKELKKSRGKRKRGMSVTQRKRGVNVLEREVRKIKILISEKHVCTHTQTFKKALINMNACAPKDHTQTQRPVVCFIDLI